MNFNFDITIDTIVSIIGFAFAIIGIWFTYKQMKETSRVNRVKFIYDLTNDLFGDDKIREFFYKIDYEKFTFNLEEIDKFKDSSEERWLDAILYRYDVIGRMVKTKTIPLNDIDYILFEIIQVYKNKDVKNYLKWLDGEFEDHGKLGDNKRKRAHDDFRWLAEQIEKNRR
ncbi:hypothetical protein [Winogradskyella sp.]|uniref:hypothetical protein n=1 Tax=Winogradskyella sp. TaxID=1883156 RepID=UPI002622F249|nr:hypothetical protein [Winogradskyella sp.]